MKKELVGWLLISYEDTMLYDTKERMEWGNPYENDRLLEQMEGFDGKRVKIVIEEIE